MKSRSFEIMWKIHKLHNEKIMKNSRQQNTAIEKKIDQYRQKIDHLDNQIIEILVKRCRYSKKIGEYKKRGNMQIFQKKRETQAIKLRINEGEKKGLNNKFIKNIFQKIFSYSRSVQKNACTFDKKGKN
jgi:chorismate mutase